MCVGVCVVSMNVTRDHVVWVLQEGSVEVDGLDLTTLNVKSLRSKIGVVSQEPALFAMSVHDNIALGMRAHAQLSRPRMASGERAPLFACDCVAQVQSLIRWHLRT